MSKPGELAEYYCFICGKIVTAKWHDSPEEIAHIPPEYQGHEYDDPECPICHEILTLPLDNWFGLEWSELPVRKESEDENDQSHEKRGSCKNSG